ncbi:MAG TPA: DUF1844 domain-containing protein [Candidatus Binataceae bacterium]|nr:DUF1844 domain-containing protein [Candidatus Binataceae bacterium]
MDREEEEKSKGFKVEDRRRFSAEGELKPEHRGAEATPAPAPPPSAAAPSAQPTSAAPHEAAAAPDEITFATFMVGLSTQALMHLGEIRDPQDEEAGVNLVAAQQLIDIVGMLKDKTRGNLDHNEEALIEAILFELRMKYVERSRHG